MADLTDAEYEALRKLGGFEEDAIVEYAVVYFLRGKPFAEGPYPEHVAVKKAAEKRGVVAERTVTTTRSWWYPKEA